MNEGNLEVIRVSPQSSEKEVPNKEDSSKQSAETSLLRAFTGAQENNSSVMKFMLRVKRLCFDPRPSTERHSNFVYLPTLRSIFENFSQVFDVHIDTIFYISIVPVGLVSPQLSPSKKESVLIKPSENLVMKGFSQNRKDSGSSFEEVNEESDIEEEKGPKDFIFSYLFDFKSTMLGSTAVLSVDKLLSLRLEQTQDSDFYTEVSKILGNIELLNSKDKENYKSPQHSYGY